MLTLTSINDYDCKTYLPIGVITALVGSLFGKLVKFYREEVYKHVQKSNENLSVFRSDTKVLRDCLMKIWINLSKECNSYVHELVLESLSECIEYLELEEMDQKDLFSLCSNLINSDYYPIEITAYNILDRFVSNNKYLIYYLILFLLILFLFIFSTRLCELRQVSKETDTESDQVPVELSSLPLQKLQDSVNTMLLDVKYVI